MILIHFYINLGIAVIFIIVFFKIFQNVICKCMAFNKSIGPGKKSKTKKRKAYIYSGLMSMPIAEFVTLQILDAKGENNPEFHRATVG